MYYYDKENLQYRKYSPYYIVTRLLLIIVFIFLGSLTAVSYLIRDNKIQQNDKEIEIVKVCEYPTPHDLDFSKEELARYLIKINVQFPHIVLAQAEVESGNFKSNIFLENHNLFGMKEARIRPNLAVGTNRGHAYYTNWKESVMDYALWQCRYGTVRTEEEYFELLGKMYAEAPRYVQTLQATIRQNNLITYIQEIKEQ